MLIKKTWLSISDNTNISWLQIFHLYKGFNRKKTGIGFFIKGSARIVEPPKLEYKGYKFKFNKKGDIGRSFIVRTKYRIARKDGCVVYFPSNNGVMIKKKQDLKSKYLFGPISSLVKRKKFKTLFKTVI